MSLLDLISIKSKKSIEKVLSKFPIDKRKSAILESLHILQDQNGGYLTNELQIALAQYLQIENIEVYEVATFYNMYNLNPTGKYKLNLCTNISCMLNGAYIILNYIENKLNIKAGETTKDGLITLKEVECQGSCCSSPVIEINKIFYENLNIEKINTIINSLE